MWATVKRYFAAVVTALGLALAAVLYSRGRADATRTIKTKEVTNANEILIHGAQARRGADVHRTGDELRVPDKYQRPD